jgi:hypothetical protein
MFRILPPLVLKVLVPALLTVVLVIAGAVVSQSQVRSIPAVGEIRSSVAAEVKPSQSSPANEQKVDYDLIIKDIVQIFKWMETPGMTPIKLAAEIRGVGCDYFLCSIAIGTTNASGGDFHWLSSNEYLRQITVYAKKNKLTNVNISLKSLWMERFSPTEFIRKLSEGSTKPIEEGGFFFDCVVTSRSYCPETSYKYSVDLKKRYFQSTRRKGYYVKVLFFSFREIPDLIQMIGLEIE